ncbi:hypothetical protein QNH28_10480 [Paenibacillus sp. G2S3]|uniref:hypothetical protein n=1 Tax=Paenibacillus sp. G2S3 TaxID=3047872 RepID=UPI0024C10092|nr:hypothetical protein [Paenibacillus sp. G2S3]WHY22504.1 hypothetical protein QNH28_10480 [Paenibacillus sp. G2S3]
MNIDVIQGYRGDSVDHDQGNGVWDDIHFIDIRTEKIFNNGTSGQFRTAPILICTAKYGSDEVGSVSNIEMFDRWIENGVQDVLKEEGIVSIAFSPLAKGLPLEGLSNAILQILF